MGMLPLTARREPRAGEGLAALRVERPSIVLTGTGLESIVCSKEELPLDEPGLIRSKGIMASV